MINFKEYAKYLINNKLSERQFTLLYFLYAVKEDRSNIVLMKDFIKTHGVVLTEGKKSLTTQAEKIILIEKGWLSEGGPLGYQVTDKFTNSFVNTYVAGQEFIAAYPGFTIINGSNAPLKNSDREVVRQLYAERIQYSLVEHKRVLEDIAFGKQYELIKVNIESFVRSEGWWDIRERRLANNQAGTFAHNDEDF